MKTEEHHKFDPKKPIGYQDDMRTAYYRGHRHLRDPPARVSFGTVPEPHHVYSRPLRLEEKNESETRGCYIRKPTDPDLLQNPHVQLNKIYGMKDLDGRKYTGAPKPIKEFRTITNTDYDIKVKPLMDKPFFHRPKSYKLKSSTIEIDPAKPGFSKYLDMMATTNMLNYVPYREKGLQQNDILTVWNWIGYYDKNFHSPMKNQKPISVSTIKEELCAKGASDICPRRRAEFPSIVKHVPHSGFTSESRDNYRKPICTEFDVKLKKCAITTPHQSLVPYMGMNKIYGSGEPVDKFVSIKDYNKCNK